ncbi:MAG: amidohydrolase family protein [Phycisphaerales bacterium]|nr:amidohydrolase family protein [Phycisphaerales bacterium]
MTGSRPPRTRHAVVILRRIPVGVLLAGALLLVPLSPDRLQFPATAALGAPDIINTADFAAVTEAGAVVQTARAPATASPAEVSPRAEAKPSATAPSFVLRTGGLMDANLLAANRSPTPAGPAYVVVRSGRIHEFGFGEPPRHELPEIHLPDTVVCPGFVSLGGALGNAHRGPESVSGLYQAADTLDRYARNEELLARGTTTSHLSAGEHRLVSGVGALAKVAGPPDQRLLRAAQDLCINLGVFDPPLLIRPPFYASSDVEIEPALVQRTQTRLGTMLELRERIADAAAGGRPRRADGTLDAHAAGFAAAWHAALPLRIRAREAADVSAALELLATTGRSGYLVDAAGWYTVASFVADAAVPLVVRAPGGFFAPGGNLGFDPEVDGDAQAALQALALHPTLRFALAGAAGDRIEDLRLAAIAAVRAGVSEQRALAAITRVPAEIAGIADRVGSLAPGTDADLLVLSGPPLDINSHVLRAYIGGVEVYRAPVPRSIVVRAGTIWVGNGEVIHNGSVLIEDGRVQAIGQRVPVPPRSRIVDAGPTAFVTPGFIDAHGHLGLAGDATTVGPELPIHRTVAVAGLEFRRVAQAGVTTVLLAPYRLSERGARLAAIKTWGATRAELVTRELSGVRFSLLGSDPLTGVQPIRQQLEAGKKYAEQWQKYAADLEKWRQGEGADARPATTDQVIEDGQPDPITGKWEYTVSGDPLPEPVSGTIMARLSGNRIEARLSDPLSGEEVRVTGTLDGNQVLLEIDLETPVGKPIIRATLSREDYMVGKIEMAGFAVQFEATRVDKSAVEFRVTRRRSQAKDGRPTPPKVDERLEPIRTLLAGEIAAVVDVRTALEIRAAVKLFVEEFKLALVLRGADDAADIMDELRAHQDRIGVIVSPQMIQQRARQPYFPAVDLSRNGFGIALQSAAEDAARDLPRMALFAVQQGLGGDAALRALTLDAARMHKLDDRIGSLQPGRDGDLLVFTGHPFDGPSRLAHVFVRGQEVPHDD